MTSKVNGKTGNMTPCRSETPENFITKIKHIDYFAGGNTHAKFYGNRPKGVRPTNSQNITSCDFVYLPFPILSFPSLPFPSRRYCVKTKKASGMISSPSGSPKTLVFGRQISSPNSKGFPPNGGLKQGSVRKIQRFSSFKRQYLENGSRYGQSYY